MLTNGARCLRYVAALFLALAFLRATVTGAAQTRSQRSSVPLSSSISTKSIQQIYKQSPNGAVLVKRTTGWSIFEPSNSNPIVISSPRTNPQASQRGPVHGPPTPCIHGQLPASRTDSSDLPDVTKGIPAGTVIVKSVSTAYIIKPKSDQPLVLSNSGPVKPAPLPVQCPP
jgi:hypothetical protein